MDSDSIDRELKDKTITQSPEPDRKSKSNDKKPVDELPLHIYSYPFENIVLEGGGNKAIAYCGAIRLLEEVGIWKNMTKFCGVSSGAMVATLLAVGYNSYQLEMLLTQDVKKLFQAQGCGKCGPKTGGPQAAFNRLYDWMGKKIKQRTGKLNITFAEVHKQFGHELCIVVTNLSRMSPEYLHVKTSPNMPVRLACKMSMAAPGVYPPVKYKLHGERETFADGTYGSGYPVHSFDGWWLSLLPDDTFAKKTATMSELPLIPHQMKFDTQNERTLGMLLFSDSDRDNFKDLITERDTEFSIPPAPNTQLARTYKQRNEDKKAIDMKAANLAFAVERLLKVIKKQKLDYSHAITSADFEEVLAEKRHLHDEDLQTIFGFEPTSPDAVIMSVKHKKLRQVSYQEFADHLQSKGLRLQYRHVANNKALKIGNMTEFYIALMETILVISKRGNISNEELQRTIGIHTQYVEGMDYDIDKEDKDFLIEQGKRATRAFLHSYIMQGSLPQPNEEEEDDDRKEFSRDELSLADELSQIIDETDYAENCEFLSLYQ